MRYCPICNTERFFKHLKYKIIYFWKHKIKGEPEPEINPIDICFSMLPAIMMASVVGQMANDIDKAIKKSEQKG